MANITTEAVTKMLQECTFSDMYLKNGSLRVTATSAAEIDGMAFEVDLWDLENIVDGLKDGQTLDQLLASVKRAFIQHVTHVVNEVD